MNNLPLVSISCITYNHASYIKECIDGFLMQKTNFNFEVLIHDDHSTDGTEEIIKEYAKQYPDIIKPLFEKENQYSLGKPIGSAVWNLPRARGEYIAICEGDDYWTDPYKLQKQVDFLESHPDYGMCYTKVKRFVPKNNKFIDEWGGPNETMDKLLIENTIPTLTAVFHKAIYYNYLTEIHPSKRGWLMGDYPIWLYFAQNSKIKFINETTGVYRICTESASHSNDLEKIIRFNNSYHDIRTWYNSRQNTVPQKKLDQNQAVLLFNSSVFRSSKEYAKLYYKRIENKTLKIRIKYWACMLGVYPIIRYISKL
ncbi:glycosyltransferase [Muribaculum gordoncarteri]|jgi:glycosyltransferase involved in cell wall biosynthesis|uniref:Glycosyltransferase n=5 Tax=Muribaculum TaxID=1918540 RepID=A0A4P7VEC3_9BACT|nr:glycosyltransferase [Muribaculum gordoncarteri]QCD35180.1 glycosyltransferase [Muribaculum gordoncarteri]